MASSKSIHSVRDTTSTDSPHGFDFGISSNSSQKVRENGINHQASSMRLSSDATDGGLNAAKPNKNVADFFSSEVFQIVLHNPATAHQLLKFSSARMCGENMEFLERVDRFNGLLDDLTKVITEIHSKFVTPEAPKQLGLASSIMKRMNTDVKVTNQTTLPALELMFSDAQEHVENTLAADIYPRFVKHQMTMSAVRALSGDRQKYAGLGDCFCLTNPSIADNPIVFASDGFVKVTGYSRQEIIPRNCRFLQGNHTDQSAVRRLRLSIDANKESVELPAQLPQDRRALLESPLPPLLDGDGKTAFFLGGQINCSTTIHSCSDILRLLSASEESDAVEDPYITGKVAPKPSKGGLNNLFKNMRSKRFMESREAGMEQSLLQKIEKMDFREQIKVFHTAYSKYLVLSYDRLIIHFFSPDIPSLLSQSTAEQKQPQSPTHSQPPRDFIGQNIFKVLTQHAPNMARNFKSRIKYSLQEGRAISADIDLVTKSSAVQRKSEHFVTHWTPLKDETANVKYVVVTLSLAT